MAEQNPSEEKKWGCGQGRCCAGAAVLVVLALMTMSGAIGYLLGKTCAMSRMNCDKGGGMHMMSCPVTSHPGEEPAPKK